MSVATPTKTNLGEMTAAELSELFASGEASPVEATRTALDRIERFNPSVNAFAYVVADAALAEAKASEDRWRKGEPLSPIDGAPTTIKELTAVKGIPWRRGSILGGTEPSTREIEIVERLRAAGATILGTTTSPEFGWKGLTPRPRHRQDPQPLAHRPRIRAARRAGRRSPPRSTWVCCTRAPTVPARSAFRPRSAVSSASSRPSAGFPQTRLPHCLNWPTADR